MALGKHMAGKAYVKYRGLYEWDGLYKLIWNWLANRDYEVQDKRYKRKKAGPMGDELKVDIVAELRETDMTKRHFSITIRSWDTKEKWMDVNGTQKLMAGGRIWIIVKGDIEFDWQKHFSGSWWKKMMGEIWYWTRKKDMEQIFADDYEYEVIRLETEIKKHLGMTGDYNAFVNSN